MDDYEKSKLETFLERTGQDATVDDIYPAFEEKKEEVEELAMEDLSDQRKADLAVNMLSADDIRDSRMGGDGEEMDLNILSIGHRGVFEDWGQDDVDTVFSHAVIQGPLGEDGEQKAAKAIFFNGKDEMDLLDVQQKFSPLAELQATYEVEEAWNLGDRGFYRAYPTENTELVETEIESLPEGRDEKNDLLRRMFPDVNLADLAENGDGLSAFDPDSGYTHDWGADIQRFEGTVVDYYIADDRSFGVYTLMDDSVVPEDIEGSRIVDTSDDSGNTTPGLTVWASPDYHMSYGNNSILDVYGVIRTDDNGQIVMDAAGVVPIVPMEMDDESDEEGVEATETSI
jgi:hypothetical protein